MESGHQQHACLPSLHLVFYPHVVEITSFIFLRDAGMDEVCQKHVFRYYTNIRLISDICACSDCLFYGYVYGDFLMLRPSSKWPRLLHHFVKNFFHIHIAVNDRFIVNGRSSSHQMLVLALLVIGNKAQRFRRHKGVLIVRYHAVWRSSYTCRYSSKQAMVLATMGTNLVCTHLFFCFSLSSSV